MFVREPVCSTLLRAMAHLTRVEGYDYDVNVWDPDAVLSDPNNPWEANNAVPDLLFDDPTWFEANVPAFKIEHQQLDECLVFLNSGGVTHKTVSLPLRRRALRALKSLDDRLVRWFPKVLATQRSVVLRRVR